MHIGSIWEAFWDHLKGLLYFEAVMTQNSTVLKPRLIMIPPSPAPWRDPDLPLSILLPLPILSPYSVWDSKIWEMRVSKTFLPRSTGTAVGQKTLFFVIKRPPVGHKHGQQKSCPSARPWIGRIGYWIRRSISWIGWAGYRIGLVGFRITWAG